MVELHDTLILDGKARRLSTGELAASVRCARTGLQDYSGSEVGRPELDRVVVYRPEAEVMKRDSFATFAGVPVTIEHPKESVTTDNWKQYAVGEAGDEVVRDGEFIRVPILVRDESAIRAIQDGKRQISMGYSCSLEFVDGLTPDGKPYQAIQRDIKINHLAVVDRARGGEALTVEDERTYSGSPDGNTNEPTNVVRQSGEFRMPHTLMIDGLQVPNVSDEAKAAIEKLQGQLKDEKARADKAEGQVATLTTDKGKLEGEKVGLEKQLKDATDPATLQAAAASRAALINKAVSVSPNIVTDGKSDADIRKEVVNAKLGDDAKDFDDAKIEGAFLSLTRDAPGADPVRDVLSTGVRTNTNDSGASVRDLARASQYN